MPLFSTGHLLLRRSMTMMPPHSHLILTLPKSPVPSRLPRFELPGLHQNCLLLLTLTALRLSPYISKSTKTTFLILLINRRRWSTQNTIFHLNGSTLYPFKKGSSLSLDNQRRIAKSCAISKVRNKILLHRIKPVTESKLLGLRSGIRPGSSTTEQFMTLRFLLDAVRAQKRSLTAVFVHYCKDYDSLDRRAMTVD